MLPCSVPRVTLQTAKDLPTTDGRTVYMKLLIFNTNYDDKDNNITSSSTGNGSFHISRNNSNITEYLAKLEKKNISEFSYYGNHILPHTSMYHTTAPIKRIYSQIFHSVHYV